MRDICGIYNLSNRVMFWKMCKSIAQHACANVRNYIDSETILGVVEKDDLEANQTDQIIFNEDKSVVAVCCGNISNFKENRNNLNTFGHKLNSNSNTEVITHLYEEYGEGCVNELKGEFIFSLWDSDRKRLILASGTRGQKALYYYFESGILAFASDRKALVEYLEIRKNDYRGVEARFDFLPNSSKKIHQLPLAYILLCQDQQMYIKKYENIDINGESDLENKHFNLLIVINDSKIRSFLSNFFKGKNYRVHYACDAREALSIIYKIDITAAVVDIKMPGFMDGFSILRYIKKDSKDTKVVLIAGCDNKKDKAMSEKLGAYAYFKKPFNLLEISEKIESVRAISVIN